MNTEVLNEYVSPRASRFQILSRREMKKGCLDTHFLQTRTQIKNATHRSIDRQRYDRVLGSFTENPFRRTPTGFRVTLICTAGVSLIECNEKHRFAGEC